MLVNTRPEQLLDAIFGGCLMRGAKSYTIACMPSVAIERRFYNRNWGGIKGFLLALFRSPRRNMQRSLKEECRRFCQTSTIKGLGRAVFADHVFVRLLWISCITIGLCVTCISFWNLIGGCAMYETSTSISFVRTDNGGFPDVLVCGVSARVNNSTALEYLQMVRAYTGDDQAFRSMMTASAFYQNVPGEIILDRFVVSCNFLLADAKRMEPCRNITRIYLTDTYPACLIIHPPRGPLGQGPRSLSAVFHVDDFNIPIVTDIAPQPFGNEFSTTIDAFLLPEKHTLAVDQLVSVGSGQKTTAVVREERRIRLPSPYTECNQNPRDELIPCHFICNQDHIFEKCGCYDTQIYSTSKQRSMGPSCWTMTENTTVFMERVNCVRNLEWVPIEMCDCRSPCRTTHFRFVPQVTDWPHFSAYLSFYLELIKNTPFDRKEFSIYQELFNSKENFTREEMYRLLRENDLIRRHFARLDVIAQKDGYTRYEDWPLVTPSSTMASLGGLLNLWVGITFMTFIEVVELLFRIASVWLHSWKSREPQWTVLRWCCNSKRNVTDKKNQ